MSRACSMLAGGLMRLSRPLVLAILGVILVVAAAEASMGRLPLGPDGRFGWLETDIWSSEQEAIMLKRTARSQAMRQEAEDVLAGGVASSWQDAPPCAVWIDYGKGSRIWDVDGTEYSDFHGGFGVGVAGHAHPAVVAAVQERVTKGTHFAQPTEDAIVVGRELAKRFGLPLWRYNNSGTESTMDAFHLMRVATGRNKVIKVEGSYHGHHDSAQVSVYPTAEEAGSVEAPNSVRYSTGIPDPMAQLTVIVPFGNLAAVELALETHKGDIAGMIVEPVMMNVGMIPPPDGLPV